MLRLIEAFKDPHRRPRLIIWAGLLTITLVLFTILSLGVTSTRWFCENACHKVQDDTITAYRASSHSNISCMACHGPADGSPVKFVLHKAEALGELYMAVTKSYSLPLNATDEVAAEMPTEQCTQCHSPERKVTPDKGIIIDHSAHMKRGITCTTCHNRVAHPEKKNLQLMLTDPRTGKPNRKHEDYMTMTGCFRCHGQGKGARAPGSCRTCHPKDFSLKPASHLESGFYMKGGESGGHAKLAVADLARIEQNRAAREAAPAEKEVANADGRTTIHPEPMDQVSYCGTCHDKATFCVSCHGTVMPHPANWKKNHGREGRKNLQVCANCHAKGPSAAKGAGTAFCSDCHHKVPDKTKPWIKQHFIVAKEQGIAPCYQCHDPVFCAKCHVAGGKLP